MAMALHCRDESLFSKFAHKHTVLGTVGTTRQETHMAS